MSSAFATTELELDLDQPINEQLLPTSQYHADPGELLDFNTAQTLDTKAWKPFEREQFQLGITSGFYWIKTSLRTSGNQSREIAFKLHHSLDNLSLKLSTRGEEPKIFPFGMGNQPSHQHEPNDAHSDAKVKPDHVQLRLLPNKTYYLLLRIQSTNPVVSGFRALDHEILIAEQQVLDSWLYAYLLVALLITIYSSASFLVTRDTAYLYHVSYLLSVMLYLLTDAGYISTWFGLYDLYLLHKIILISLTSGMISIMLFFKVMSSNFNQYSYVIKNIFNGLIYAGFLIVPILFVTPHDIAVKLLAIKLASILLLACYMVLTTPLSRIKKGFYEDYRSLLLRTTLIIFPPLALTHLLTRMGFIEVFWVTDYILFLGVFIKVFLIAGMLLLNLRHSKQAFRAEELTHRLSLMPNKVALERQLQETKDLAPQTLLQVWASGLDGLQTTLGTVIFHEFLVSFGQNIKQRFGETAFLTHSDNHTATKNHVFHSDQNTFILLCRQLNEEDQQAIVGIVEAAINTSLDPYYEHFSYKVFIGAHVFDSDHQNLETVIQKSALALSYGIKNSTQFNYYNEHIGFNEARSNRLITDFHNSLNDDEFFLLWQPQYDTRKNTISGVEVLARWKHSEYGMIGPDEFIPLLEKSHRISDLTKWVVNKVFNELPLLHQSAGNVEVSINLSTRDLSNTDLVELLDEKLVTHKHLVPYITMEITESMIIDDYKTVLANVNRLQERGFKVSIDDFGSGYASFAYLQSLPANELKIDKCYTDRYEEPRTLAILESVIDLAKNLNISIVVEGVESTQQIERFTKLGVHRLQGWALGKPMSLNDLILKAS